MSAIARARFTPRCEQARRAAARTLASALQIDVRLSGWSGRAAETWKSQWTEGDRRSADHWDWEAIHRRYRNEPDRLDLCMWVGDQLCGLALATLSAKAATINFLEGQPDPDCPLIGYRALLAIEATQNYAQITGRQEVRVWPIAPRLEELYRDIFRFELATPNGQQAYYWRKVP